MFEEKTSWFIDSYIQLGYMKTLKIRQDQNNGLLKIRVVNDGDYSTIESAEYTFPYSAYDIATLRLSETRIMIMDVYGAGILIFDIGSDDVITLYKTIFRPANTTSTFLYLHNLYPNKILITNSNADKLKVTIIDIADLDNLVVLNSAFLYDGTLNGSQQFYGKVIQLAADSYIYANTALGAKSIVQFGRFSINAINNFNISVPIIPNQFGRLDDNEFKSLERLSSTTALLTTYAMSSNPEIPSGSIFTLINFNNVENRLTYKQLSLDPVNFTNSEKKLYETTLFAKQVNGRNIIVTQNSDFEFGICELKEVGETDLEFRLLKEIAANDQGISGSNYVRYDWNYSGLVFCSGKDLVLNLCGWNYGNDNSYEYLLQRFLINMPSSEPNIFYTLDGGVETEFTSQLDISETSTIRAYAMLEGYDASDEAEAIYTFPQKCETPFITPNGGTYTEQIKVFLTCNTPGARIFYTKDGSEPNTGSTEYGGVVNLYGSGTLKVIAVANGYADSGIASETYVLKLTPPAPTISPKSGTYNSPFKVSFLAKFYENMYYTIDGTEPTEESLNINTNGFPTINKNTTVKVKTYVSRTWLLSDTATAIYEFIEEPAIVIPPKFSIPSGTYSAPQNIFITSSDINAEIRYTTDGTEPTRTSILYSSKITINKSQTIKAKAFSATNESETAKIEIIIKVNKGGVKTMNNTYGIPGVTANFLDYQINKSVPIGPGKVNVILGDLPDTYEVSDGTIDGTKTVPFPANVPMLVNNGKTTSKLVKGTNIIGNDETSNDMANVMRMLDLTQPTAFCKVVKRDGSRPNMLSLHEKYQAFEHAYEELANYPASRIVLIGTAFDETFAELKRQESYMVLASPMVKNGFIRGHLFGTTFGNDVWPSNTKDIVITTEVSDLGIILKVNGVQVSDSVLANKTTGVAFASTTHRLGFGDYELRFNAGETFPTTPISATIRATRYETKEFEITKAARSMSGEIFKIADRGIYATVAEGTDYNPVIANTIALELGGGYHSPFAVYHDGKKLTPMEISNGEGGTMPPVYTFEEGYLSDDLSYDINGVIVTLKAGFTLESGFEIDNFGNNFEDYNPETEPMIIINVVPKNADIVLRAATFCNEMTLNLTECKCTFGVLPPKNTSAKEIRKQVARLTSLEKANRGFVKVLDAGNVRDLGIFVDVVVGAVKVGDLGGITNFPEVSLISYDSLTKTITIPKTQLFKKGTPINIYTYIRQDIANEQNIVYAVDNDTDEEYTYITLVNEIKKELLEGEGIAEITIQNIENKDDMGTYLAALYANVTSNFGIASSYIKATMPGTAELTYTRDQMIALGALGYTVISKDVTGTAPLIIDTPTMARNDSDFTDQSSRDLIFYFLNVLREISKPYKGERFGEAAKRSVFESGLKSPFENQLGKTILNYSVSVDYDYLQTSQQLFVDFAITEAKTGKQISIQGKLLG